MLELPAAISLNDVHHGIFIGTHSHFHLFCSKLATSSYRCSVVSLFYDRIKVRKTPVLVNKQGPAAVLLSAIKMQSLPADLRYLPPAISPTCHSKIRPSPRGPQAIPTSLLHLAASLPPQSLSRRVTFYFMEALRHTLPSYCVFPLPAKNVSVAIILVLVEGAPSTQINDNFPPGSWIQHLFPPEDDHSFPTINSLVFYLTVYLSTWTFNIFQT